MAAWLLAVGTTDLLAPTLDSVTRRRAVLGVACGAGTSLLVLALSGASLVLSAVLTAALGLLASLWLWGSRGAVAGRWSPGWPLGLMGGVLAVLLATTGLLPAATGLLAAWYDGLSVPALEGVSLQRFLTGLGSTAYLQVTGNVVVRLVLTAAGTPPPTGATLRGGRLLGPMERTFLFGLGLAGELTAAAVVVAAKGALRFPELSAGPGVSGLTEYFLIGTLSSLLVALAMVALV
jgi:hypothetical protein